MSKRDDGWPAFPRPDVIDPTSDSPLWDNGHPGMSLRDWFAGQALMRFHIPAQRHFWRCVLDPGGTTYRITYRRWWWPWPVTVRCGLTTESAALFVRAIANDRLREVKGDAHD